MKIIGAVSGELEIRRANMAKQAENVARISNPVVMKVNVLTLLRPSALFVRCS